MSNDKVKVDTAIAGQSDPCHVIDYYTEEDFVHADCDVSVSMDDDDNLQSYDPSEEPSFDLAPPLLKIVMPEHTDESVKLMVGIEFESIGELYESYLKYAQCCGFSVVKRNLKTIGGIQVSCTLTCQKGSRPKRESPLGNPNLRRAIYYTGCPARLVANFEKKKKKWIVSRLEEGHNHLLFPNYARFMRSHQILPLSVQKQLEINDEAGVPIHKSIDSIFCQAGGQAQCMFTEKNMRRHLAKVRRLKLGEGDSKALLDYFERMQRSSPGFFYSCDFDDESRLINVFWADSRGRAAAKEFADIVTFDSTYLTNKYNMAYAMFITMNHHKQSVLLASVLLGAERVENYQWALRRFIDCFGKAPDAIITDQCQAICNAIRLEFPGARHRLCLWHIMNKLPSKLGPQALQKDVNGQLANIVCDSRDVQQFENSWKELIKTHSLENNEWLAEMYDKRSMWVPVFVKGSFWGGMSTTQRSESMNAFFDGYVNSKTTLKVFISKFEEAMKDKYEKEAFEDYWSLAHVQPLSTTTPYEIQCAALYTRTIQKEFRDQCVILANCSIEDTIYRPDSVSLLVRQVGVYRPFQVVLKDMGQDADCECKLFQFNGILCAHVLCAYRQMGIYQVPDKYILRRWRKDIRRSHMYIKLSSGPIYRDCNTYDKIFCGCYHTLLDLVEVASCNKDAEKKLMEGLNQLLDFISGESASFLPSTPATASRKSYARTNNSSYKASQLNAGIHIQNNSVVSAPRSNARTPVTSDKMRVSAVQIQNGQTVYLSAQNSCTPGPFIPLDPPGSPRTGRPPSVRLKCSKPLDVQRVRVLRELQLHPSNILFKVAAFLKGKLSLSSRWTVQPFTFPTWQFSLAIQFHCPYLRDVSSLLFSESNTAL